MDYKENNLSAFMIVNRRPGMSVTINLLASKSIFHRVSICTFLESLQGIASTVVKGNFHEGELSTDMRATQELSLIHI